MKEDVEKCLLVTGADSIMSAEGVLSNPCLFAGLHKNICEMAREYLDFAEKYDACVSAIRAHIFRITHYRCFFFLCGFHN